MLDDRILDHGAVALVCSEDVPVRAVVSQGCRPIGTPLTVTRAERNLVYELAGQPAMARLQEIVQAATDAERDLMRNGLHLGVVVDEHQLDFSRGDFLVRNVLGADRSNGAIAIGERVEVGHDRAVPGARRRRRPTRTCARCSAARRGDAALLFTCNGRGRHLFPEPNHDAGVVEELLGPVPLAARSARARSARSAAATSCTASPRASRSSNAE